MSDNIPLELQVEIIKRVPVKSLISLRSVSKEWKSLIDSPNFADEYCLLHSQLRLLIRYLAFEQYKYVSIADDDTFQQHQIPTAAIPISVNNLKHSAIVGCSHGLFCFYGFDISDRSPMVVLWNPWIRKSIDVPVPNVPFDPYQIVLGFGVGTQTMDPKIVKIISYRSPTPAPIPWRVDVFTLSSGTWKSPSSSRNNLPYRNSIGFYWSQVALDGVIYWHAFEMILVEGRFRHHNLIMSFDLISEGFEEICLPDNLASVNNHKLSISMRMESVVVLEMDETRTSCGVWMMGQGVTKSFTKLFTVMPRVVSSYFMICGFMKNGEPIVDNGSDTIFAYDSYSEQIKDLGIVRKRFTSSVNSYMETLLLIDQ